MDVVRLGRTATKVGALCLGTDAFGSRVPARQAAHLLDRFVDAGGTLVDTANAYACWAPGCVGGESERVIGMWAAARGGNRVQIATKVGFGFGDTPEGLRAEELVRECEDSLRRLRTDTIEIYLAHCDDPRLPVPEIMAGFERLVCAGKVRYVGISNWPATRLAELPEPVPVVEYRHTFLAPVPTADFGAQRLWDRLVGEASNGSTLIAYAVLLGGTYTRADRPLPPEYASPANQRRLTALREVAAEVGATANQVVLAWLRQQTPPVVPVVAASTTDQLDENLAAATVTLPPELLARLDRIRTDRVCSLPEDPP